MTATKPWEIWEYERAIQNWQSVWDGLMADLRRYENKGLTADQKAKITEILDGKSISPGLKGVENFYRAKDTGWNEVRAMVEAHRKKKPSSPATKAPVFAERKKDRRETFVHIRGVYFQHGDKVSPGTPSALPDFQCRGLVPDRLGLARWLFKDDNPLTARVAVNRIWQQLFGQGLVATSNDFGTKGSKPTHPRLLDWLAIQYRRLGWSRKAMIRLIVASNRQHCL